MDYMSHNGWPYNHIEHWPPMTYKDRPSSTSDNLLTFLEFLETENNNDKIKEVQPWLPFCEGKCSFCYFTVNCEKRNVVPYISALKKALVAYAKTKYIASSVFDEASRLDKTLRSEFLDNQYWIADRWISFAKE